MIELAHESLIPIRDIPSRLPRRPSGRRVHVSAVYRWIQRGIRGVRLETVQVGGSTYTSVEALQRFANGLSRSMSTDLPVVPTALVRQKQLERAEREVQALLGRGVGDNPKARRS